MSALAAKIAWSLLSKFITETFASRILVHGMKAAAAKTTNKVDDQMAQDVADALGVK